MDNKAVNKILEAEAEGAKIINDAHDRAEKIIDEGKQRAAQISAEMEQKQRADNANALKKAEQKGQTKAAIIKSNYNEEVERLKRSSKSKREQAVKAVLEMVLK